MLRGPVSASGSPCKVLPPEWNEVGGSAKNSHVVVESMKKKKRHDTFHFIKNQ